MSQNEELISYKDAAELYGRKLTSLYSSVYAGRIESRKHGDTTMIVKASADQYFKNAEQNWPNNTNRQKRKYAKKKIVALNVATDLGENVQAASQKPVVFALVQPNAIAEFLKEALK